MTRATFITWIFTYLSNNLNVNWLKMKFKQTSEDQFKQRWARDVQDNSKATKSELMSENYLVNLLRLPKVT